MMIIHFMRLRVELRVGKGTRLTTIVVSMYKLTLVVYPFERHNMPVIHDIHDLL